MRSKRLERWWPYLLIAPAALYLAVVMGYPLVEGIRLSVTDTGLLNPTEGDYVGVDNYRTLLSDPEFWDALWVTLVYTVGCVVGAVGLGLLAALGMNRLKGNLRLLRGLVIIPWAAPVIPVALVATWILDNQYGVLNWTLMKVGLIDSNVAWLNNENTALPAVLVVTIWRIFPFSAIVLLAALQAVPDELYEAARVDGASSFNRFKNVTFPVVRPTVGVLALFVTIWSIRRFDLIWVLTEGGPLKATTTLVIDLYHTAFRTSELGMGSAIGVVGLILSTFVTIVYFLVQTRSSIVHRRRHG